MRGSAVRMSWLINGALPAIWTAKDSGAGFGCAGLDELVGEAEALALVRRDAPTGKHHLAHPVRAGYSCRSDGSPRSADTSRS